MKCKTGKRLIHQWATAIKSEKSADVANYLLIAPREYDRHAKKCKICGRNKK